MNTMILHKPDVSGGILHWFRTHVTIAAANEFVMVETPTKDMALSTTEAHLWGSAKNAERLDAAIAQSRKGEGHFVELDHLFAELGIDVDD